MKRAVAAVLGLGLVGAVAAAAQQPAVPGLSHPQVLLSVQELMDAIVDPSADVVWTAVGTVVDQGGFHDALPKTDEQWHEVRRAAVRLVEGGNLLMMPGRRAAPLGTRSETPGVELEPQEIGALIDKDRMAFDGFAKALQDVGLEAVNAIDAHDGEKLLEVGSRMENVCESCHQTFWYPPKPVAP